MRPRDAGRIGAASIFKRRRTFSLFKRKTNAEVGGVMGTATKDMFDGNDPKSTIHDVPQTALQSVDSDISDAGG